MIFSEISPPTLFVIKQVTYCQHIQREKPNKTHLFNINPGQSLDNHQGRHQQQKTIHVAMLSAREFFNPYKSLLLIMKTRTCHSADASAGRPANELGNRPRTSQTKRHRSRLSLHIALVRLAMLSQVNSTFTADARNTRRRGK